MQALATRHKLLGIGALAAPLALYLALAGLRIAEPFMDEETWEFFAAKTLLEQGKALTVTGQENMYHPHGYYFLLAGAMRLLGAGELAARLVGVVATIACFLIMLRVLARLGCPSTPAVTAMLGALYLCAPAVIQGSLVITADTAVHHACIMLTLWYIVARYPLRGLDFAVVALMFAGLLWVKLVTPCLILAALALFYALRREWRNLCLTAGVVGLGSLAVFALTWWLYTTLAGSNPTDLIGYLWMQIHARKEIPSLAAKSVALGRYVLCLAFWLTIPYSALMAFSAWRLWRDGDLRRSPPLALLLTVATVLCVMHLLVSGMPYAYPRYHFTMLPIWAILATVALVRNGTLPTGRKAAVAALFAGALGYFLLAGDSYYILNHDLKAARLSFPGFDPPATGASVCRLIAALLPLVACAYIVRRRTVAAVALFTSTLAAYAALNLLHACAPYAVGASYGEEGSRELIAYCRERLEPDGEVLAQKDLVYHISGNRTFMEDWRWGDDNKAYLLARMRDPRTQFVILGLHHNTVAQIAAMAADEDFRRALTAAYRPQRIGTYFVWERAAPPLPGRSAQ